MLGSGPSAARVRALRVPNDRLSELLPFSEFENQSRLDRLFVRGHQGTADQLEKNDFFFYQLQLNASLELSADSVHLIEKLIVQAKWSF